MGKETAIAWTHHTWSPWWGCTKVSPGCEHCYADGLDRRTGGDHWGPGKPRRALSATHWRQPGKWNRAAMDAGERRRVFPSMCDPFDSEVAPDVREAFWEVVRNTAWLDWLLVTKRPENFKAMLPADWERGYANVWLGVSAEDQQRADARIPLLLSVDAVVRFVSAEPLLSRTLLDPKDRIDWVIVGGESGGRCRPMSIDWARMLLAESRAIGAAFFMKQLGGHPLKFDQMRDFPEDLRIREFPEVRRG